jgi:hypothetical protein
MSKEDKAVNREAVAFVRKVITEVYGQKASQGTIAKTAQRVMATLPEKSSARGKSPRTDGNNGHTAASDAR